MVTPFYNAVKGTTAGTPSTGAFTPNAASTGFRAWSTVPTGWIGLVRYEDGSAWELTYSYWNGTTLSRASTQVYDSSTGSQLTLTSAATAAMIVDASDVMSHLGTVSWRGLIPNPNATSHTAVGIGAASAAGTAGSQGNAATTNYLTEQQWNKFTSATTVDASAGVSFISSYGVSSSTAGRGGWELTVRCGASQLPTNPRLFVGLTTGTVAANAGEPSALVVAMASFAKDSTDTNIQLLVNATASGAGTKTDTGIPLAVNGWYEFCLWTEPGSTKVYGLLIRLDTGAIWLGSTTTDVPTGVFVAPAALCSLNSTNTGTAVIFHVGGVVLRSGS